MTLLRLKRSTTSALVILSVMLRLVTVARTSPPPGIACAPTAGGFPPGAAEGCCACPTEAQPIAASEHSPIRIILSMRLSCWIVASLRYLIGSPRTSLRRPVDRQSPRLYESSGFPPRELSPNVQIVATTAGAPPWKRQGPLDGSTSRPGTAAR